MQKNILRTRSARVLSVISCVVLIAALALCMVGCNSKTSADQKSYTFTVVDLEGKTTDFQLKTDKETVGAALLEEKLIAGETGEYGLYVQTVNGITLDYNTDGAYWAFYIGDEYAQTGVDSTAVTDGGSYTFRAEKAQ